jgi:hypothetical protein
MKKFFLLLTSVVASSPLLANMGPQGFGEFRQKYFVETGTYFGESVHKALNDGFQEVRSIEQDGYWAKVVRDNFAKRPNVKIYHGDSSKDLWDMIKDIDEPITFWLDAHIFPPRADGGKNCPLIEELEQIKQHPIKSHIILIDDMHCCGTAAFDFMGKEHFIAKLLEINPNYQIRYVDGGGAGEYKDNVMVAILP